MAKDDIARKIEELEEHIRQLGRTPAPAQTSDGTDASADDDLAPTRKAPSKQGRMLLAIMELHAYPVGAATLALILSKLSLPGLQKIPPKSDAVRGSLDALQAAGQCEENKNGFAATAGAGTAALDAVIAASQLEALASACNRAKPAFEPGVYLGAKPVARSGQRVLRALRAALLLRDDEALRELMPASVHSFNDLDGRTPLSLAVAGWDQKSRLKGFTELGQVLVVSVLVASLLQRPRPSQDLYAWLDDPANRHAMFANASLAHNHMLLLLLRGELSRLKSWLDMAPTDTVQLLAAYHLTTGDLLDAQAAFLVATEDGLAAEGRKSRGHFVLPTWLSFLQLGLEAREGTAKDFTRIAGCCRKLADAGWHLQPTAAAMEQLMRRLQGEPSGSAGVRLRSSTANNPPNVLELAMAATVSAWIGAMDDTSASTYAKAATTARAAGMGLLADQLVAALGLCVPAHAAAATEVRTRASRSGITLWCDLLRPKPRWVATLEAIAALAEKEADSSPTPQAADGRILWCLQREEDWDDVESCEISACLQKAKKKGGWTKGRTLSVQTLQAQKSAEIRAALTDEDRRLLATFEAPRSSYYYTELGLPTDATWQALVGMDRVVLGSADGPPVEVTAMRPQVRHETAASGHRLRLDPPPPEDGTIRLIWPSDRELQVWQYDGPMLKLATLIGPDGLDVPEEGRELLERSVAAVSHLLPVATESGLAIGRAVPTDPRPHLLLAPYEHGLRGQFRVRPLGPHGPCLRPAFGGSLSAACEGETLTTERDAEAERAALDALVLACPTLDLVSVAEDDWILPDPADCLNLLAELHGLTTAGSVVVEWPRGRAFGIRGVADASNMAITVRSELDWFEIDGELRVDEGLVLGLRELMQRLSTASGRFVQLDDGQFLALSQRLAHQLQQMSELTNESKNGLQLHHLSAPSLEEMLADCGEVKADKTWKKQTSLIREIWNWQPTLPPSFQGDLREYQWDGFDWLARIARWGVGACLADEMGLGKTVQALAAVLTRSLHGPTLVVAPTSVCENWIREAARFAPTLRCRLYAEADDRDALLADLGPGDLVACSFTLMALDADRLVGVDWQGVILDEAQAIKNRETLRARSVARLRSHYRIATTGTPVENHLGELWSLFHFLNPGLLGSEKDFRLRYQNAAADTDPAGLQRLKATVRPFILRRTKSAVLVDLPPRTDILVTVRPEPPEVAFYEALRRRSVEHLEVVADQGAIKILAELMRLRRACCHPSLVTPDANVGGAKLDHALELIEQIRENGHKCLIFSQFVDTLQLVKERLDLAGFAYQYLDGSTPAKQRQARVDAFQKGEGDAFLISLKAGGTGLNLTRADYVIHLDPWWNPAVEDQASDRAHRIGQDRPVTVYRLVVANTIEEKIVKLHHRKRDLADAILSGSDVAGALDATALLALLRDS